MNNKHTICIPNIISTLQYITAYHGMLWQVSWPTQKSYEKVLRI